MREIFWGETRCGSEAVQCYLLAEALGGCGESYGILLRRGGEQAAVPGLTVLQRRIQALADVLMRGGVTPVALRDVVDDWLLE